MKAIAKFKDGTSREVELPEDFKGTALQAIEKACDILVAAGETRGEVAQWERKISFS